MTVEIHGVFRRHPWIDQVSADHDLDEDLFSLVVKRAAAYGWSSAFIGGLSDLAGARWGHADAGNDWSQDGRNRRLAWLTVHPTAGMARQHLPVLPMTRVMTDSLYRMGNVTFTALSAHVPLRLAPDTALDLRTDADWYALTSPAARTGITVTISADSEFPPAQVLTHTAQRSIGQLRIDQRELPTRTTETTFTASAPEWTPDAAAWVTDLVVNSPREAGVRGRAVITASGGRR
ncbi:hypothetical protein IAG44_26865 [Streptomyces roseirectus]|uniref:Uncharacterized protein n=2 Tax=Streptomyces roseirectus TaxID=2768066 RepID=A0A7H0IT43_9ACTN|nr:hypothetical protein IAG44_26865 [Streptomyces roseirectus]